MEQEKKMQEKELYSKACVARSIKSFADEAREESVGPEEYEKFSCNLATILTRDREVVAVRLRTFPYKSVVYIAKNGSWHKKDDEYIDKIKKYVKSISKDAPIRFRKALDREDVKGLFEDVMEYCSAKLKSRFEKLKKDIIDHRNDRCVRSFINTASIDIENIDELSGRDLTRICCKYYKKVKNSKDSTTPENFLKHLKKVGSYYVALVDLTVYACKESHKSLFSYIDVQKLEPVTVRQPIFSWQNIIQRCIPNHAEYEKFKKRCLNNRIILTKLREIYGNVDALDNEHIEQNLYLHTGMNILTNIINQKYQGIYCSV